MGSRAASHTFNCCSYSSHTCIPSATPPSSPSSGRIPSSPRVFLSLSSPPSDFFSIGGTEVAGTCNGTTAHSAYKAPGLSTSSGARFCGSSGANVRYLNGVGRKSACKVDCSVEAGDFVRIRRSGLSKIYLYSGFPSHGFLGKRPESKCVPTHSIIPTHETPLPRDESAARRGAITSVRLMPGDTDTATMFER